MELLSWLLLPLLATAAVAQQAERGATPVSPCPFVYSYSWAPGTGWHGVITIIPPARFSEVQLTLRQSLPYYHPEAGVGRVEVKGGDLAIQEISRKAIRGIPQKIQYNVIFPPFRELPKVASIIFNGKDFCPTPQVFSDTKGRIELKYVLKSGLNIPVSSGSAFSVSTDTADTSKPSQTGNEEVIYVVQTAGGTHVIPGSMLTTKQTPPPTPPTAPTHPPAPVTQPTPSPSTASTTLDPELVFLGLIDDNNHPSSPSTATTSHATRRPSKKPRPKPSTATTPTSATPTTEESASGETSEDDFASQYEVNTLSCGVPATTTANTLVIRGEATEKGQWPWQAAMFKSSNTGLTFQCGGSLISRRHVVTAGHCVYLKTSKKPVDPATLLIYLGKHNLRSWTEAGQQAKDVERVLVHPQYGLNNHDYDLAILVLSTPADISNFVKPVCLWDKSDSLTPILNKNGFVLGWGRDEVGNQGKELMLAKMPVVSQETCLRSDPFYSVFTSDSTYCAGFRNGTSVCNGDSGGGMYFHLDNPKQHIKTWYTRGVVSVSKFDISEQACDEQSYVVFTDLAKLLPWIREQLPPPAT